MCDLSDPHRSTIENPRKELNRTEKENDEAWLWFRVGKLMDWDLRVKSIKRACYLRRKWNQQRNRWNENTIEIGYWKNYQWNAEEKPLEGPRRHWKRFRCRTRRETERRSSVFALFQQKWKVVVWVSIQDFGLLRLFLLFLLLLLLPARDWSMLLRRPKPFLFLKYRSTRRNNTRHVVSWERS